MDAKIKLTRYTAFDDALPLPLKQSWPIKIDAVGTNIPSEIFVYHASSSGDPIGGDKFECVASMNQLEEIPKSMGISVSDSVQIPYYRRSSLEFVCRNADEADYIWTEVVGEATALCKNYNAALRLKAISSATITETQIEETLIEMTPPTRYQISYRPAGTATYSDESGLQDIINSDVDLLGWLPVADVDESWLVPPGAKFFYNISKDAGLQALWPLSNPISGNTLHWEGVLMPYGVVYVFTKDTIYWMDYTPNTLPEIFNTAPWPEDYVSAETPGDFSPTITLTLYK